MLKRLAGVIASTAVFLTFAPAAVADTPTNPSCWGSSAATLAQTGGMGDHASSFASPRLGIGNVAYLFTGTHQPGELAGVLGGNCWLGREWGLVVALGGAPPETSALSSSLFQDLPGVLGMS
jgi:hypothetical protein